jgi:hypothetical protein
VNHLTDATGDLSTRPQPAGHRPIVKLKIREFDEQRFDESRTWDERTRLDLADLRGG